jgi:hypothetical protein
MQVNFPRVYHRMFTIIGVEPQLVTLKWFMTLFTSIQRGGLNKNYTQFLTTVFDLLCLEGNKALIKISMCLLNDNSQTLQQQFRPRSQSMQINVKLEQFLEKIKE